jgi:hypothetical protein
MILKNLFGKKKEKGPDPLTNLTLENLRPGCFVDYDMKTWQVSAYHYYDWGSGDLSYEWQLQTHDETIYLERSVDDEDDWSISRKIPFARVGAGIKQHIIEHEDPPEEIAFEGTTYYLEETSGGQFYKDAAGPGQDLLSWEYEDDSGKKYMTIEQWGESDFEASIGEGVEEYQFTNILPAKSEEY